MNNNNNNNDEEPTSERYKKISEKMDIIIKRFSERKKRKSLEMAITE